MGAGDPSSQRSRLSGMTIRIPCEARVFGSKERYRRMAGPLSLGGRREDRNGGGRVEGLDKATIVRMKCGNGRSLASFKSSAMRCAHVLATRAQHSAGDGLQSPDTALVPVRDAAAFGNLSLGSFRANSEICDLSVRWTDGFAEGSVGPRPCGNWNIFLAGSGQWGPITIQPKGDSKCHRCVCG